MTAKARKAKGNGAFPRLKELMLGDEQRELTALRERLGDHEHRLGALRDDLDAKQRELATLRDALDDRDRRLNEQRGDLETKSAEIAALRDASEATQQTRAELRADLDAKERRLNELRADLETKATRIAGLADASEAAHQTQAELRADLDANATRIAGLADASEAAQKARTELRSELEAKERRLTDLRSDLDAEVARIAALRDDLAAKGAQITGLQEAGEGSQSQISSLRNAIESGQRERAGLRDALDEKERALAELRENLAAEQRESGTLRDVLAQEQRNLIALRDRLDAREANAVERLSDDLAAALRRRKDLGQESFDDLVAALQSGTESAIQRSVSVDKKPLATALFPIMGPAIRNYVVELFRNLAAELNETISNATSAERIKWRFQAKMAGKPYSEYVLLKTRSFRIEEVYLMQRDTGLLLLHAALNPEDEADGEADLVSGMFTAIRSFVRDSFAHGDGAAGTGGGHHDDANGDEEELDSFTFGEREVLIEVGPSMVIAAVAYGVPAPSVRNELKRILENLHAELQDRLDHFSGDTAQLEDSRPTLRAALCKSRAESEERSGSGGYGKLWIALGTVGLGIAAWIFFNMREQNHWDRFESALRGQPGLAVTEVKHAGWWRHREVRGLRDPLATDPAILAAEYDIAPEKTSFVFGLMESLDPAINARRAAAAEEEKKTLRAQQDALRAQLEALRDTQTKAEAEASVRAAAATETLVRSLFADIPGLEIAFTTDGFRFQGDLAEDDYRLALSRMEPLKAVGAVDSSGLSSDTSQRLAELLQRIASSAIPFQAGALKQEDEKHFDQLAGLLRELNEVASKTKTTYAFTILSHPLIGPNRDANRVVEKQRADQVRQRLIEKGIAADILEARASEDLARAGQGVTVLPAERSTEP